MSIIIRYSACDGFGETKKFASLTGARRYAQRGLGETPELGSHYAISGDGIAKITVEGCALTDLFPKLLVR